MWQDVYMTNTNTNTDANLLAYKKAMSTPAAEVTLADADAILDVLLEEAERNIAKAWPGSEKDAAIFRRNELRKISDAIINARHAS